MEKGPTHEPKTPSAQAVDHRHEPKPPSAQAVDHGRSGPMVTPDVLARVRAADSVEEAVGILTPKAKRSTRDTIYKINPACRDPLPKQRGPAVLVYATAARLDLQGDESFSLGEIEGKIHDGRSVGHWVRQLAKSGHFIEAGHFIDEVNDEVDL